MEKEEIPEIKQESQPEKINPNTIGEVLNIGKDLPTFPDKVYRSVMGKAAIDDIENSGIVRNKQSAGLVEKSRWGERVFWSRGAEGKYHNIQQGGYVIEAPLSVAEERVVTKEDITAIYTKSEDSRVIDILKQNREAEEAKKQEAIDGRIKEDEQKLADVRKSLGISE